MARNMEQISRSLLFSQFPDIRTSAPVTAVSAAGKSVIEVPYIGRHFGAIQISDPTGAAWVATFVIEGTLADIGANDQGFLTSPAASEYFPIGSAVGSAGIVQLPFGNAYGRIRVRCTAYTSGNPVVKVL